MVKILKFYHCLINVSPKSIIKKKGEFLTKLNAPCITVNRKKGTCILFIMISNYNYANYHGGKIKMRSKQLYEEQ